MSDTNDFLINKDNVLSRYHRLTSNRSYQSETILEVIDGLNSSCDAVIELPTGMGKTMIFSPIAAECVESNKKVAILSATKQGQMRLKSAIKQFLDNVEPTVVFGTSNYSCPLLDGNAQFWCCHDNKESYCEPMNLNCDIIKLDNAHEESNLIVSNFSKFLLAKTKKQYDYIILDDSHSFENTKDTAFQLSIVCEPLITFYDGGISDTALHGFLESFLNIFSESFGRDVDNTKLEGSISHEHIVELSKLITKENETAIKNAIISLNGRTKQLCWDVFHFVKRTQRSSQYQFFIRKDFYDRDLLDYGEFISRTDDKTLANIIKKRFGTAKVIFATATPGNWNYHASMCTHRNYDDSCLRKTPADDSLQDVSNWFKRLNILVVTDIPDTRKPDSFNQALTLSQTILQTFDEKTLILFKNYRDQKLAKEKFESVLSPDQLYFIDSITKDTDIVEDLANKKNVSIASASSTVWEGANIKNLKIVIIVSVPFIRPPVGRKTNYIHGESRMLVRLQQGIGRIIRCPDDYGVAILTESRFKEFVQRKTFSNLLKDQVKFVTKSQVISEIQNSFDGWRNVS